MLAVLLACAQTDGEPATDKVGSDDTAPLSYRAGAWVIDHVTVVDAEGSRADRAVIIDGDQIDQVVEAGRAWPTDMVVRDAPGMYLVPGLVDAHVHLAYAGAVGVVGDTLAADLRAQLYWGVTQVVDLGGPTVIFAVRDHVEAGELLAPHILATGPMLTAVGSHPCESWPDPDLCLFVTPQDAGAAAEGLAAAGADALKVALADAAFSPWGPTPRLDVDAVRAAAATGLPIYAHVDADADVIDALDAGATFLTHPPFGGPIGADALSAARTAGAVHTTVSAFAAVGDLMAGRTDPDDPELLLTDAVRADWRAVRDGEQRLAEGWLEASEEWAANARANLAALRMAGVLLLPGSDAGYYFVPHGQGLHRELGELVALGYSPAEVLTLVTRDARAQLGLAGGTVTPGAPADLLLLGADPLLDVAALAEIDTVVFAGVAHRRADLRNTSLATFADVCLDEACPTGQRCDGLSHTCVPACDTPYAVVDDTCGEAAWCMPADGAPDTYVGACHTTQRCDLYTQDCAPDYYVQACQPYDQDTNVCWYAGPRQEGDRCTRTAAASSCAAGLFCSALDTSCYRLCDPDGADTCGGSTRCVRQEAAAGVPWFGLCL